MNEENIEKDMTPVLLEDLGMRYPTEKSKLRSRYGLYQCQYCGKEFEGNTYTIRQGATKSCGCQSSKYTISHGLRYHRMYKTWLGMVHRCYTENFKQYYNYGGRGITVCDEWKDVRNFVRWVDDLSNWEEGLTLDRINTNGNYCPENCTFSNKTIQSINQRKGSNNTSGFVGISWVEKWQRWGARIKMYGKEKHIGHFKTLEEAILARDNYIIQNNLPHPLSTDNKV